MKRFFAMLLVLAILTPCLGLTICAASYDQNNAETDASHILDDQMVPVSCRYDTEKSRILVGGSIRHDILVKHSDYTLEVYALKPNEEIWNVLADPERQAAAGSAISVKFEFSIEAKTVSEKYARYCVVLRSPDGQTVLTTLPKYAELTSSFHYEQGDRSAYKGIGTSLVSKASDAGAGRLVLPIYFDRLTGTASGGVLFRYLGENVYFDEAYVEALDLQLRSASAAGTQVYVQLILPVTDEEGELSYLLPDVYDERVLFWIEAMTAFLCRRYGDYQSGVLSGIIVGKDIDRGVVGSLEDYAQKYVLYLLAVANAARSISPALDIVLPFSETNSYTESEEDTEENTPSRVLEAILSVLDSHLVEPFLCTTWIESSTLPLTVSEDANPRFDLSATANDETLHAANLFVYAAYLDRLSHRYESAPQSFTFVWSVERGMDHATVDALYAYSYFQLHATPRLSSFVVSFHEQEEMGDMSGFSAMSHLYTYIDTEKRDAETAHLRQSLGIDAWGEISEQIDDGNLVLRSLYESRASLALPDTVRGEFFYADFASAFHMDGWFAGYGCEAIRLAYGQSGNRALQIEMTTDADIPSEAFWLYEYPENFVYTPYVALNLFLEANGTSSLYEVRVTVGEGKDRQVTSAVIHPNENSRLVMDLSPYSQAHMADYWKISVRSLDGDADSVSVWVYDIVGYSTDLDSDALREAILAERARIRNLSGDAAQTDSADDLWTVLAIVVLILVIGVGVFIGIRSQDNTEKERDSDERS